MTQNVETGQRVFFFDPVAITQHGSRVEFFAPDRESFGAVEAVIDRLCDNLPHTPVAAIGLNYVFIHDDPDRDLEEKFELQTA